MCICICICICKCNCVYVDLVAHDALLICKAFSFYFYVDVVFVHCQKYERKVFGGRKRVGGRGDSPLRVRVCVCVCVDLVCRVSISIFNFSFINFAFSLGVLGFCLLFSLTK
ncbi:hypothetical protein M5D96_004483 [Drosophila gunungcola]|uniref:Uncharacterized protein n=1 Tax=Drosophila gunungcola TaxID=103775 RepID=A0A9P9YU68_9MUSC|nr:hypothetical protein M5D96_004483 [Drosophila gunungcola]